jgi:hypothetical protein
MSQVTFDSTDNPEALEGQKEAEARALEIGEKLVNEQEEVEAEVYENARKQAESQLNYAGKFRTAEDLEKAYIELERKLGQAKQEDQQPTEEESDEEQPDEPAEVRDQEGQQGDEQEGVQVNRLTPEEEQSLLNELGGDDFYNQATKWAAANFSKEEIAAYDGILYQGDRGAVTFAVKSLIQQFKANGEYDGAPVSGKAVRGQGVKPFRSQAELARAINNPKYREDPAYRLDVEQRLAVSDELM